MNLNKKAPNFIGVDQHGNEHTLSDYNGKWLLLYFYPRDNTPGCTTEAETFRDMIHTYTKRDVVILGVSPDSVASHATIAKKFNLPFSLLADEDKKIITS